MKTFRLLFLTFLAVLVLSSCERREGGGVIYFKPSIYTVKAAGGEVLTSYANERFHIHGSTEPLEPDNLYPPYFHAEKDGQFLQADFFTAEVVDDSYRIKFNVEPNMTGKERKRYIKVEMAGDFGSVLLTQTAD